MSDSYREVTSVSWFGRIKRSVGGFLVGLLLVVAMVVLLFWNEGRAVTTARSLAEGASTVLSVNSDLVDAANDGKLVHVSGAVTTKTTPADADFGISAPSLRLVRSVEMYQWKEEAKSETTTKLGGGEETVTTYTYVKEWDDRPVDSSNFKKPEGHSNPTMEIRNAAFQVPAAKLGAFDLDEPVLDKFGGEKPLAITPSQQAAIDAAFPGPKKVSVVEGRIYLGFNPTAPSIGDYRVSYELVPIGDASIVGRQSATKFVPYQTVAGDQLLMVRSGSIAADAMFADAVAENTTITWLLRVVGLVVMFIGYMLLMGPVGVMADFLPFIGSIVRFGTGLIAFVLAVVVAAVVIALAWFWYRPMLALAILAGGAAIAVGLLYLGRARRTSGALPPTTKAIQEAPVVQTPASTTASPGTPGKIAW